MQKNQLQARMQIKNSVGLCVACKTQHGDSKSVSARNSCNTRDPVPVGTRTRCCYFMKGRDGPLPEVNQLHKVLLCVPQPRRL